MSFILESQREEKAVGLAFGLKWLTLSGVNKESDEIKSLSKNYNSKYFAKSAGIEGDVLVGLYEDESNEKIKGNTYSGSAAFSRLDGISNVSIFVYKTDDGGIIVCGSKGRRPVVGFDYYGSFEEGFALYQEFVAVQTERVSIYSNLKDIDTSGTFNLSDLAEVALKDDALKKSGGIQAREVVAISAVSALLAASVFGWFWYQEKAEEDAKLRAEAARLQNPNVLYKKALDVELPKITSNVASQWESIAKNLGKFPLEVSGWSPEEINCDILIEKANCKIKWYSIGGTFQSFWDAWRVTPQNIMWNSQAVRITHDYTIPLPRDHINFDELPAQENAFVKQSSYLQQVKNLGVDGEATPLILYPQPPGVSSPSSITQKDLILFRGSWSFSGDYWKSEVIKDLGENFTATNLNIKHKNGNISFSIKGNYYAKK